MDWRGLEVGREDATVGRRRQVHFLHLRRWWKGLLWQYLEGWRGRLWIGCRVFEDVLVDGPVF
jgi:hypothetical protein